MTLFNRFCNRFLEVYIREVKDTNRNIAVAGLDFQSAYFSWLLDKLRLPKPVLLIDDTACQYGVEIFRELELDNVPDDVLVGFVPGGDQKYMNMFRRHGVHTVSLEREMGCKKFGFYEWLEDNYGVDLIQTIPVSDIDHAGEQSTASGPSRQMGMYDVLRHITSQGRKLLDIGSGKGGAMVIANQFDFDKVEGIEISPGLCDIAMKNLDILGYDGRIINQSAINFDGYGEYDVLYMYDPFRGDVFRKVMDRIEECIGNKPVVLIYANPYYHKDVVKNGIFRLEACVNTDFFHRTVKVYTANGAVL